MSGFKKSRLLATLRNQNLCRARIFPAQFSRLGENLSEIPLHEFACVRARVETFQQPHFHSRVVAATSCIR